MSTKISIFCSSHSQGQQDERFWPSVVAMGPRNQPQLFKITRRGQSVLFFLHCLFDSVPDVVWVLFEHGGTRVDHPEDEDEEVSQEHDVDECSE